MPERTARIGPHELQAEMKAMKRCFWPQQKRFRKQLVTEYVALGRYRVRTSLFGLLPRPLHANALKSCRLADFDLQPETPMTRSTTIDTRQSLYSWNFATEGLDDRNAFENAFKSHNEELEVDPFDPTFVLVAAPRVVVLFDGVRDGDDEYSAMEVVVTAEGTASLSFLDFMYRLHMLVHPYLVRADAVFFEGVVAEGVRDGAPLLRLVLGS